MATTRQDAAVTAANELINLMALLKGVRQQVTEYVTKYNKENYSATWAALATAAQNANGSLGTADGAPVATNPIDTRVTTGLSKAVTKNMLTAGVVALQQLQNFFGNVAVVTGDYSQSADDLAS